MKARTALFVGDVSLDLTLVVDHFPMADEKVHARTAVEAPGGVVTNAAVACTLAGADVALLLQTGSDMASGMIEVSLRERGIDVRIGKAEGRTCRVVCAIEPHGEKRLLLDPGVSMFPSAEAVASLDFGRFGWVHTAAYGNAVHTLVAGCREAGVPWSLDLEPATFPDGIASVTDLIGGAEVVFCNNRAAERLGPAAPEALLGLGARSVVRMLGAAGAFLREGYTGFDVPIPVGCKVVDTTGAGDCLAGWFVARRLSGTTAIEALADAVAAASLSVGALGAQASYPALAEVEALRRHASKIQAFCRPGT